MGMEQVYASGLQELSHEPAASKVVDQPVAGEQATTWQLKGAQVLRLDALDDCPRRNLGVLPHAREEVQQSRRPWLRRDHAYVDAQLLQGLGLIDNEHSFGRMHDCGKHVG